MDSVKRETGAEICRGCLSTDRRLSPLANYDLFFALLNDKQKLEALKCPALMLCWECGAGLRRMKLFQTQVWNAHRLLEETANLVPVQGLSQLSISHKQDYDVIIEDEPDYTEEPLVMPIKNEETKVQTDTLELNFDQDGNLEYVDNDIFESHDELNFSLETMDNYLEETINTSQKKLKRKLKTVRQPKTKVKRIKIDTNTNTKNKSNRAGLRSSGEVVPPLYPFNKNNNNTKGAKTKSKVNNTIKRKGKNANSNKPFIKKIGQIIIAVEKENKTPDYGNVTTKNTRNEVIIDVKEANTDSGLENAEKDDKNPTEIMELGNNNIEQNDDVNDDDGKTDSDTNDDPDFEEEFEKDSKIVKVKQKGVTKTKSHDPDYEEELEKDTKVVKVKQKGVTKTNNDDPDYEEELEKDTEVVKQKGVTKTNNDDPDYEEELEKDTEVVKVKQKGVTKTNNDDPDYEEELEKDTEVVKVKQKGVTKTNNDDPDYKEELVKDTKVVKVKQKRVTKTNNDDPDYEEEWGEDIKIVKVKQKGVTKTNFDNNDDPGFEEELGKDTETVKVKQTNFASKGSGLHRMCIRFDITVELDEYFTKVDLSPEEVRDILDNELSYTSEELPYGCHYCGMCFQHHRALKRHKGERHKIIAKCKNRVYLMYRCNFCDKTVRKDHTEAHMKYMHRFRYSCKECDQAFWDKEEGQRHYMEHKAPLRLKCGVCEKICNSTTYLENHVRDRHTLHPCEFCNKIITGLVNLQKHLVYHEDGSKPEQRYCVTCDRQYVSVGAYEMHLKRNQKHKAQPPQRFPCSECDRVMTCKQSLRYHFQRFHVGKTKFQCPHCVKDFARGSGLTVHIKLAHLKQKPPKDKLCSICGRGFSKIRTLTHHVRTHTGERPHVCPHCPAAFAQPYPLRKHLATQHPEAPRQKPEAPATQVLRS